MNSLGNLKTDNKKIVFGIFDSTALAKNIAKKMQTSYGSITICYFPDDEFHIKFNSIIKSKNVYLVCGLHHPNEKIVALCLAAKTAKELGAKSVTAIVPYLAYMRQDKRFQPGEAVSSRIIGNIIGSCIDKIVTIDPHLHRVHSLSQVYPCKTKVLTAMPLMIKFLKKQPHLGDFIVVGPDKESYQWISQLARGVKRRAIALQKTRFSSRKVKIDTTPLKTLKNKIIVIVDDVASTAHTIIAVVRAAKQYGVKKIYVLVVHPLFVGSAYKELRNAGAHDVYSCNTIPHITNKIDVSEILYKV